MVFNKWLSKHLVALNPSLTNWLNLVLDEM